MRASYKYMDLYIANMKGSMFNGTISQSAAVGGKSHIY